MKKVFSAICLAVFGCFAAPAVMAAGTAFTIDCPLEFDEDLDGWKIEGTKLSRNTADWFGHGANTPDYVIGGSSATSADVIFSPVKKLEAGEPCTLEFYFNSPGGTPNIFNYGVKVYACSSQSLGDQIALVYTEPKAVTTGWKKITVTYTPETTGDVCFAIQPDPYSDGMADRCGWVGFDSFIIEGFEGAAEPADTPFEKVFTFDNDEDFPGINVLPKDWSAFGVAPFRRYSAEAINIPTPPSGEKILGTVSAAVNSKNYVATEFFVLKGNAPATFCFSYSAKSESLGLGYGFHVYASTTQSLEGATLIGVVPAEEDRTNEWFQSEKFTFTPETDGKYCFIIDPYNEAGLNPGGPVGLDDIMITGYEGKLLPPVEPDDPKGNPEAFIIDCSLEFDEDLDGWKIDGDKLSRNTADWFGYGADTPSYVIGGSSPTSEDIIFTPVKQLVAGEPCTLEFAYKAPGGTPANLFNYGIKIYVCSSQSLDDQIELVETIANAEVADWKKVNVTYTPQEDADVCFAIQPVPYSDGMASRCGWIGFDSFVIEGTTYGAAGGSTQLESQDFFVDCPLEFEDDFTDWAIEGSKLSRNTGDYFGLTPDTPDYIIGATSASSADVIFSPVKKLVGGKPCTLEFAFNSPGGTPANLFNYGVKVYVCSSQSLDSQIELVETVANAATDGWKKVKVTYTPQDDADVCFAIQPTPYSDAMASRCGIIGFDSFIIEGTAYVEVGPTIIELDPNPDHVADCIDLPYFEDFNGGNYDGTSYLPKGWISTGSVTWITSAHKAIPAVEGDYYMVAPHNTESERDDRAYTPFVNLEAGKTYTIDYYVYMQGNRWNDYDVLYLPTLTLTVGTEQEADFHNPIATFSKECTTWVPQSYTFTPEKSGPYCFAFMLSGPVNSGYVFVDALKITSEGLIARVEPSFAVKGLYTLMDSEITLSFKNEPLQLINTSKYAESYKWTVAGAEPSTSTEENPSFVFPADGDYTVILEATNAKGTRKTQRKLKIQLLDETVKGQQMLTIYNANEDNLIPTGQTPAFDIDPEGDFVSGYNHYYYDIAQRFDFSENVSLYLKQLSLMVTNRRYRGMTPFYDDQRIRPFSLVVYGADENGNLDETNVLGRLDTTIGEALGSSGIYSFEPRDIVFPTSIEIKGTFYIAFHFDRGMEVIPQNTSLGRSYFSYQVMRHAHGQTTLYAKPFDKPAVSSASLNEWCTVDNLDSRFKGLGSYWQLWAKTDEVTGISAINPDGTIAFAASFIGGGLNVSGTAEGEIVEVYNLSGHCLARTAATDVVTVIPATSFADGVYIVKSGDKAVKVVKSDR